MMDLPLKYVKILSWHFLHFKDIFAIIVIPNKVL